MLVFTILVIFPVKIGFFTALSTYSVQFVFLFLMLGMLFLVIDTRRLMFTALGCSGLLCVFLKNNSNSNIIMPISNEEASVRIAHLNLSNSENDIEAVTDLLMKTNADIISLQEYTPFWKQALGNTLESQYSNKNELVRIDPYGLAIFSKLEFVKIDTFYCKTIPGLNLQISIGDKSVQIITSYISPSLNRNSSEMADDQLMTINSIINQYQQSAIIVGEFNHVYWSNKIRTFRSKSQLLNSRRNVTPTSFSIPVDHIFHTSDLECIGFEDLFDFEKRRLGILGRYQFGILPDNSSLKAAYGYSKK